MNVASFIAEKGQEEENDGMLIAGISVAVKLSSAQGYNDVAGFMLRLAVYHVGTLAKNMASGCDCA